MTAAQAMVDGKAEVQVQALGTRFRNRSGCSRLELQERVCARKVNVLLLSERVGVLDLWSSTFGKFRQLTTCFQVSGDAITFTFFLSHILQANQLQAVTKLSPERFITKEFTLRDRRVNEIEAGPARSVEKDERSQYHWDHYYYRQSLVIFARIEISVIITATVGFIFSKIYSIIAERIVLRAVTFSFHVTKISRRNVFTKKNMFK